MWNSTKVCSIYFHKLSLWDLNCDLKSVTRAAISLVGFRDDAKNHIAET